MVGGLALGKLAHEKMNTIYNEFKIEIESVYNLAEFDKTVINLLFNQLAKFYEFLEKK